MDYSRIAEMKESKSVCVWEREKGKEIEVKFGFRTVGQTKGNWNAFTANTNQLHAIIFIIIYLDRISIIDGVGAGAEINVQLTVDAWWTEKGQNCVHRN